MEIKILSPLWGHEHLNLAHFLQKIHESGYDGIDTWIPANPADTRILLNYLNRHELYLVAHQHEAEGSTFYKFQRSFSKNLQQCAKLNPLLINSHTGRDYFSLQQQLDLITMALDFSAKTGIRVLHETHRGRLGYSPQMISDLFERNPDFLITADFSHWVCVTESMLGNFTVILKQAIMRSRHIHARVGFEQGPQVPDPRSPKSAYALSHFLQWWDEIVAVNKELDTKILTITTEFGPPPYMPVMPFSTQPIADQFEINCFMLDLLRERYRASTAES